MNKPKHYIVVYHKETDGEDTYIEYCECNKIKDLLKKYYLHIRDIAIIDGKIIKDFGQE